MKGYPLHANRIFINTGSPPYLPPIEGLATSRKVFTSISLLEQSVLDKELVIGTATAVGIALRNTLFPLVTSG